MMDSKHPLEEPKSWDLHVERQQRQRRLKKHHHHGDDKTAEEIRDEQGDQAEKDKEKEYWKTQEELQEKKSLKHKEEAKEFRDKVKQLYDDPGIRRTHVHGMMIDAGSKGSRIHLYEWKPRVLRNTEDIEAAVSGRKLTFPGSDERWTDRIKPGLDEFSDLPDEELVPALAKYLAQFLDFAKTILRDQEDDWGRFPIFLRATGGMRIVDTPDRARVVQAVRELFSNETFCPFAFTNEQARVISGEEEAIYDWANVNFLLGVLVQESEGSGTVIDPKLTFGALDMGGASTQISFYEPNEDVMANLFKLQIGQGKHWNLYAHSFLHYGIIRAQRRFEAILSDGHSSSERLVDGIYNPCLPGGTKKDARTKIHFNATTGMETYHYTEEYASGNGYYNAVLRNYNKTGNADLCLEYTKQLLHKAQNAWCDFSHKGDCSLAGVYQPSLPTQAHNFGEFLAFSNFRHIWDFLQIEDRATLRTLENATRMVCSMSREEYWAFNNGKVDEDEVEDYCFRGAYAFNLLHYGYGFQMDDYITSVDTINGLKVGWALGAMLYEINAMPWSYESHEHELPVFEHRAVVEDRTLVMFIGLAVVGFVVAAFLGYEVAEHRKKRSNYERITE